MSILRQGPSRPSRCAKWQMKNDQNYRALFDNYEEIWAELSQMAQGYNKLCAVFEHICRCLDSEDEATEAVIGFMQRVESIEARLKYLESENTYLRHAYAEQKRMFFTRQRKPLQENIIRAITEAQGGVCLVCKDRGRPENPLEPDHVVPLRLGGGSGLLDLQMVHQSWNRQKGDRLDPALDYRDDDFYRRLQETAVKYGLSQLILPGLEQAYNPLWTPPRNGYNAHGPG